MQTLLFRPRIDVPDAPDIPELIFRGFEGPEDYPRMVAVILACRDEDQIERVDSVEDVERNYKHLVNSDPYQDMLFAEIEGRVVGYGRVSWRVEGDGAQIYQHFGFLLPEWRRKGLGSAMSRYFQARLKRIASENPSGALQMFEAFAADTEKSATALLLSEDYQPIRHFYTMVRPDLENIPDAPLPPGLQVRPVQPEHYELIRSASLEAFRDHWGFSEDEEPPVEQWLEDPSFDPSLWRVAWDGDQVAGMVLSYIDRKENAEYNRLRGWTENICVRRPWRKQGLARSLLVQSLHAIKERGMKEAALGVDTQNLSGALHLYESAGFRPIKRFTTYRKPM